MRLPGNVTDVQRTLDLLKMISDPAALYLSEKYQPRIMARRAFAFAKMTPSTFRDTFRWHLGRQLEQLRIETDALCMVALNKD